MNTYFLSFLLLFKFLFSADEAAHSLRSVSHPDILAKRNSEKAETNLVFKSSDAGQTWQDVSDGLPENLQENAIRRDGFFTNDSGMYIRLGSEIYHNAANYAGPFWKKELSTAEQSSIAPRQPAILIYKYWENEFLREINETKVWSPMGFQLKDIRCVFQSGKGAVFVTYDNGLFRSTDNAKTWKQVYAGAWVMKIAESNGVLMATSEKGIIMSVDGGETWNVVLSEGGVGINIESIKGGFAAITYNTDVKVRTIQTTSDNGKTWKHIDAGLPADMLTASIVEVGEYFFCGRPAGIFRSSDKGKTWKLLLPSINNKVFNLFVSGKVIYAIPRNGGC